MSNQATGTVSPPAALNERARGQLAMLLAQFLVGLGISRLGLPWQTSGAVRIVAIVLLSLHILTGVGLVVGALLTIRGSARLGAMRGLAWGAAAAIVVTFGAGVMTLATGSDWWSYLMGAGATASLPLYGILYVRSAR